MGERILWIQLRQSVFLQEIHNALRSKYSNYREVYGDIKPVISKY